MFGTRQYEPQPQAVTLTHFDFSSIEVMDPSLSDGSRIIFDREFPCIIRFDGNNTNDILDDLRVKILVQGDDNNPKQVRIEVTSDSDLFFFFHHWATPSNFNEIKESQKLQISFREYPAVCIKSLNKCESEKHSLVFTIRDDNSGALSVYMEGEVKKLEIMSFEFECCPEEIIRQHITYRYGSIRSKIAMMEGRMQDINEIVKMKNPSLLLQIQKTKLPLAENQQTGKRR